MVHGSQYEGIKVSIAGYLGTSMLSCWFVLVSRCVKAIGMFVEISTNNYKHNSTFHQESIKKLAVLGASEEDLRAIFGPGGPAAQKSWNK